MLQLHKLIAVSGLKNSGKDTASSMLQYLLSVPKIFRFYWIYKLNLPFIKIYKKVAFADPLKEMLANLLNVPKWWFNDRNFKENIFVNFNTLDLYLKESLPKERILSDNKFNKIIKSNKPFVNDYDLSIRQLLQYWGTEICLQYLTSNIWINAALKKVKNKFTIITDLRFKTEANKVKQFDGKIIYISRPGCNPGNHQSEKEVIELLDNNQFDYVVYNNGSLKDLFNNLKKLI